MAEDDGTVPLKGQFHQGGLDFLQIEGTQGPAPEIAPPPAFVPPVVPEAQLLESQRLYTALAEAIPITQPPDVLPEPTVSPFGAVVANETQHIFADDLITVTVTSSNLAVNPVTIALRLLGVDGIIRDNVYQLTNVPTNLATQTYSFTLPEGYVLAATINVGGAEITPGITYCTLGISRPPAFEGSSVALLIADYATAITPAAYPSKTSRKPTDGRGELVLISGTKSSPSQTVFAPPQYVRWRVICGSMFLDTTATAGNRQLGFSFPGWQAYLELNYQTPPSTTDLYYMGGGGVPTMLTGRAPLLPMPPDLFMTNENAFKVVITNPVDNSDNFGGQLYVERWVDF